MRLVGEAFIPLPLDARGILFRAEFPGEELLPGMILAVDGVNYFPVASKLFRRPEIM